MKKNNTQLTVKETELNCQEVPTKAAELSLQAFVKHLNSEPDTTDLVSTPDGKAKTLGISFVEMKLDEIFYGLWSTKNFTSEVRANEVTGSIELVVTHPITGAQITRTGAASIQIMVDKAPDGVNKNQWALDVNNKKSNALDMGFPKLKAECIKNAAQSLGKVFGRDLNRKQADTYSPMVKRATDEVIEAAIKVIESGQASKEAVMDKLNLQYSLTQAQVNTIESVEPVKQIAR